MNEFDRLVEPRDLSEWRILAHRWFDRLWKYHKDKKAARERSYLELSNHLGIGVDACHIALFDIELCRRVINYSRNEVHIRSRRRKSLGRNYSRSS